jgi:hypothetical protein
MHPVEADGCGLVILAESRSPLSIKYKVLESGVLSYDGKVLNLEFEGGGTRVITEEEQRYMLNVTPSNKIPECAGFDFFILRWRG